MRLLSEPPSKESWNEKFNSILELWDELCGKRLKSYVSEISVWHVGCGKVTLIDVNYVNKHRIPSDHSFSNSVFNKKRIWQVNKIQLFKLQGLVAPAPILLSHSLFPPPSSPHVVLAEDSMHSGQIWFSLFLHSQLQCLRTLMTPRLSKKTSKGLLQWSVASCTG